MPDYPHRVAGDFLPLAAYQADFRDRFWRTGPSGCWKLERRQTFRELDNASWEAPEEGDWKRARALLEEGREDVRRYQHETGRPSGSSISGTRWWRSTSCQRP